MNAGDKMNGAGIVGLFTALEKLCENEKYEDVKQVIRAVLEEAKTVRKEKDAEK